MGSKRVASENTRLNHRNCRKVRNPCNLECAIITEGECAQEDAGFADAEVASQEIPDAGIANAGVALQEIPDAGIANAGVALQEQQTRE